MDKVALLRHAVESEVKGEPVDKALADGLVEHFGLEAEQYLGEHPDGPYSDAEVMALGLYTNGEYQHLNRSLRQGRELDAGQALIDQGMSAAFEKSGPAEEVVKTFRGTQGRDAFEAVKEGQVGHDAGYLSTSRDPSVARSFAGQGTITTLFGRSGIDVSEISIEGDEQEILYDKGTDMRVLLSAKDGQGVTRRVLEEATLGERSGHGEGLLDALDLATGTDRSGKPQEQDLRLRMRGLDLPDRSTAETDTPKGCPFSFAPYSVGRNGRQGGLPGCHRLVADTGARRPTSILRTRRSQNSPSMLPA